jgi:hypothetical protein
MKLCPSLTITLHDGASREIEVDADVTWGHPGRFNPYDGGTAPEPDEVVITAAHWLDLEDPAAATEVSLDEVLGLMAGPDATANALDLALERLEELVLEAAQERLDAAAEDAAERGYDRG